MDAELTPLDRLLFLGDAIKSGMKIVHVLCERLGKDYAPDDDNPNQCGNCSKQIPADMDYCKECEKTKGEIKP
jgi:predicted amidophosphoribosyltransferase